MILLRFSFVSVDEVGKFGHYCYAKIRRKVTPIALDQEKEKESDIERVSENVLFIESLILHALFLISYRSRLRITFRMNKMLNAVLDSRESTELKNCIRTDRSTNCSVFLRTQHFWHTHNTKPFRDQFTGKLGCKNSRDKTTYKLKMPTNGKKIKKKNSSK